MLKGIVETNVAGVEETHVRDAILHHQEPLEPAAKGEALYLRGVEAGILYHIWVEHPRARGLKPLPFLTGCLKPDINLN